MAKEKNTGRKPTPRELAEAERWSTYTPSQNPSAVAADHARLSHVNTYSALPDYYVDHPFTCRRCGRRDIWRATDQKWYFEEAKGHLDARAVECHDRRTKKT